LVHQYRGPLRLLARHHRRFHLSAYTPSYPPRRAGPYETSRGNTENFPTAPPAHTLLCPGAPSISFAPIVQARHHLDRADRFANIDYGSVFRLKPFRPHLTAGALSCATTQPVTTTHGHRDPPPDSAQRGITPAFGYGPRLGPVRLDFHQLALCAARRTLRDVPPSLARHRYSTTRGSSPLAALPLAIRVNPRITVSCQGVLLFRCGARTELAPPSCRTPPDQ
jgi:hypothetical protein